MKRLFLILLTGFLSSLSLIAQSSTSLFYESFDTIASGVPSGWTVAGTASALNNWQSTDQGFNSTRGLHFDTWMAGNGATAILKTPVFALPAANPMTLTFKYRNYSQATLAVYISTDGGATYTSQLASNLLTPNATDWGEGHFSLANWVGSSNVSIVVVATAMNAVDGVFFDEFLIEPTATCKHPENLNVYSVYSNNASLSWQLSADGMIPDPYEYILLDANGDTVQRCDTLHTLMNTVTLTGLTPNTDYTFRMRGNCTSQAAAYSSWTSANFHTLCLASPVPYFESFDSITSLPVCSFSENTTVNTNAAYSYGLVGHSLSFNPTEAEWAYYILPPLTLRADNIEVGFNIRRSTTDNPIYFHVGIVDDPADLSTFNAFYNDTLSDGTAWQDLRFNSSLIGDTRDTVMVCIYVESTAGGSVYIDNLNVEPIPTCLRPENFRCSNMTDTSVTLNWTTTNATNMELMVNGVSRIVTTNPYTVTGLSENTSYSFRIRGVCAAGDSSYWAHNTVTVTTPCSTLPSPYFTETFDNLTKKQIPGCWTTGYLSYIPNDTRTQPFVSDDTYKHGSTGRSMKVTGTANNHSYLTSQAINPSQADNIDLSVWVYRSATPSATEGIRIWASHSPTDTTGAELVAFIPRCNTESPYENVVGWHNYQYPISMRGKMYILVEGIYNGDAETYFDDLAVVVSPACRKVRDIVFDSQTATLSWTAGGTESQWQLYYMMTTNQTIVKDTTITLTTNSYTFPSIQSGTTYTVVGNLRALCGAAGGSDSVDFARTFTSDCTPLIPPYSQDFEGTAFPPACWQTLTPSSTNWARTAAQAHSGSYSARIGTSLTTEDESLVTPMIHFDATKQYEILFWVYRQSGYYNVYTNEATHVILANTPSDTLTSIDLGTVAAHYLNYPAEFHDGWYRYSYQIPTGTSGDKYVRFQFHNMRGAGTYIDDVRIREIPSCIEVSGGCTISNITDSSAVVSISDNTVNAWQVAYTTVEGQPSLGTIVSATTPSVTLTNLTPGTHYYVYVRRDCSTEQSDWSDVKSLYTYCAPATVPFLETFESFNTGRASLCYNQSSDTEHEIDVKANTGVSVNETYNHTTNGTKGLYSEQTMKASFLTYIHLQAGQNYRMNIWLKAKDHPNYLTYDYRTIFLLGTSDDIGSMNRMDSMDITTPNYTKLSSFFTVPADGDYYIGFTTYATNSASSYSVYADDWSVNLENCIPPTSTSVSNLTTSTASVNFTSNNSQWEMYVSKNPDPTQTPTYHSDSIYSSPVNFDNLEANTQYYYIIRSLCDSVTSSEWTEVSTFRTACDAVTLPLTEDFETPSDFNCWSTFDEGYAYNTDSIHHLGTHSVRVLNTSIVTPQFAVASLAPYMVDGWAYSKADSVQVTVGVMLDPTDASTYQELSSFYIPTKNQWFEFNTMFSDLLNPAYSSVAGARYVVFTVIGSEPVWFDDLAFDFIPSCPKPSQVAATNITTSSAQLSWHSNGSESQWIISLVPADGGAAVTNIVNTNPATISGLAAATTYNIQIRALCDVADTSAVYNAGSFRTLCAAIPLPYECGFERSDNFVATNSFVSGVLEENCWSSLNAGTSYPYYEVVNAISYASYVDTGRQSLLLVSGSNPLYVTLPAFSTPLANTRLQFDHINMGSGSTYGTLEVGYMTDASDDNTFVLKYTLGQYTTFTAENLTFANAPAGARIAFRYTAPYNGYRVAIDNIRVTKVSQCAEPATVGVSSITENAATLRFTDSNHSQWQYTCLTRGQSPRTASWTNVNTDSVRLTALTPATDYTFYVRAICQAGDTSNYIHTSFRTLATPVATPYVCDFTSQTENSNWTLIDNSKVNYFIIGDDQTALHGNTNALYITNDDATYAYSVNVASATAAYRPINFAAGKYTISIDYTCTGGETNADGVRFYLVRTQNGVTLPTSASGWQTGTTALDKGQMISNDNTGWRTLSKIVDFSAYPGSYNLVAAWYNNGSAGVQSPVSIGRIEVRSLTCDTATAVATTSTTVNSASFTCTTTAGNISYAVSSTDNIADSILFGSQSASSPITVGNLASGTEYYLFVRSDCSSSDHSLWTSITFATECAVIDTFPLSESFENSLFAPRCWSCNGYASAESQVASTGGWVRHFSNQSDGYESTGFASAHLVGGSSGATSILASPMLDLTAGRDYKVSFSMFHRSVAESSQLKVYLSRSNTTTAGATLLGSVNTYDAGISTNKMLPHNFDITNIAGGNYYILFEGSASKYENIYIDDINITAYPACRDLSANMNAATTMTTARITSTEATSFQVAYAVTTSSVSIADTIGSVCTYDGTALLSNLTGSTQYTIFARRLCGSNGTSDWSQLNNFTTKTDDCFTPDNISTIGIVGSDNVSITWNAAPDAASYQYRLTQGSTVVTTAYTTNDTLNLTSLAASTAYTLYIRSVCQPGDTTAWASFDFTTNAVSTPVPFHTGFESIADNALWVATPSGDVNNFTFGVSSEGVYQGQRALYISDDGTTYGLSLPGATTPRYTTSDNVAYMTRVLRIDTAGDYQTDFAWRCHALTVESWIEAFGRAFIAPHGTLFTADATTYKTALPDGAVELGRIEQQQAWTPVSTIVNLPEPGLYDLVFMWLAENQYGYATSDCLDDFPLAIDEVTVRHINCRPVASVSMENVTDTSAKAVLNKVVGSDIEYALMATPDSIAVSEIHPFHSSAYSDTLSFAGLAPNTAYWLSVRTICDSANHSDWLTVKFTTLPLMATLPYVCDFENTLENSHWNVAPNDQKNRFIVGTDVYCSAQRSLYISDDSTLYHYTTGSGNSSISYATRNFSLPAGNYEFSYDWKCEGYSIWDYARVMLIPTTYDIEQGVSIAGLDRSTAPTGAIVMDGGSHLDGQSSWTHQDGIFTLTEPGTYYLTVFWNNATVSGGTVPMAIDNITLKPVSCFPVSLSIDPMSVTSNSVDVIVNNANPGADVVYTLSTLDSHVSVVSRDTMSYRQPVDTLHLTGLSGSANYYIYAMAACSATDSSLWRKTTFSTSCGTVTVLPYVQDFESLNTTSTYENVIGNICWSALNVMPNGSNYPYYRILSNSLTLHSGSRSLEMVSSKSTPLYLVLPAFDSINDLRLSLYYRTYSKSTSNGTISLGYMTNPADVSSFVSLQQLGKIITFTEASQAYNTAPANARIAIRYSGAANNYAAYIDDIRVTRLVKASAIHDTICNGSDYNANGFSVAANHLTVGDNTLTRIVSGSSFYAEDTIITAIVYVRPLIQTVTYDTVCSGQPYNKGSWSIPQPQNRAYTQMYTSVTGCDSSSVLYLYVSPTFNIYHDTICRGSYYTFHGRQLTSAGMFVDSALNRQGCMQRDTLYLAIERDSVSSAVSICQSALPYHWCGMSLTQSGSYDATTQSTRGCSIHNHLDLKVYMNDSTFSASFCHGGQYFFRDTVISTAGSYDIYRINAAGCYTTYHLTVTEVPVLSADVYDDACQGKLYTGYGIIGVMVNNDTIIDLTVKTVDGCDSLTHIHLHALPVVYGEEYATIHKGEAYTWNNNSYTEAGDYTATLIASTGCDSVATLHLSVISGVDDVNSILVDVYPNPVRDVLHISCDEAILATDVYDAAGHLVLHDDSGSTDIDFQSAITGTYLVRISTARGTTNKLVIKQ